MPRLLVPTRYPKDEALWPARDRKRSDGRSSALDLYPITTLPLGRLDYLASITFGGLPAPKWLPIRPLARFLPVIGVPRGWVDASGSEQVATPRYLRNRLIDLDTPKAVKDQAWRHIAHQARDSSGPARRAWCLYALATGFPALIQRAALLHPKGTDYQRSIEIECDLLIEFIEAMHRLDLEKPNVFSRLVGAAYDQASGRTKRRKIKPPARLPGEADKEYSVRLWRLEEQRQRRKIRVAPYEEVHASWIENALQRDYYQPRADPSGFEDVYAVLDRLVESADTHPVPLRLEPQNAALIRRTYLDKVELEDAAAELGMSYSNASGRRKRAAKQVARLLGRYRLAGDDG